MELVTTPLDGLYVVVANKLQDDRGYFARTYCKNQFQEIGFDKEFVQFNHSFNKLKGTIRGMHYQLPPFTETKLIRCVQGSVYDVAIDCRNGSPTFLHFFGIELSADNMYSMLIPEGFAHGFQTMEDNTALIYHHTAAYAAGADAGIRFDDPAIQIEWKLPPINVSNKDKSYNLINKNFKGINI